MGGGALDSLARTEGAVFTASAAPLLVFGDLRAGAWSSVGRLGRAAAFSRAPLERNLPVGLLAQDEPRAEDGEGHLREQDEDSDEGRGLSDGHGTQLEGWIETPTRRERVSARLVRSLAAQVDGTERRQLPIRPWTGRLGRLRRSTGFPRPSCVIDREDGRRQGN